MPIQLANRAKLFCRNELESSNPVTSLDGFCRDVAPDLRLCNLRQCPSPLSFQLSPNFRGLFHRRE